MTDYSPTSIFTLVPEGFSNQKSAAAILGEIFPEVAGQQVLSAPVPQYGATLLYAWENGLQQSVTALPGVKPKILKQLADLAALKEHNKLIVDFDTKRRNCCILLAEGSKLICANSYHTVDFPTALYYMLELLNKSQINPQQTTVNYCGKIEDKEMQMLKSYVKDVRLMP